MSVSKVKSLPRTNVFIQRKKNKYLFKYTALFHKSSTLQWLVTYLFLFTNEIRKKQMGGWVDKFKTQNSFYVYLHIYSFTYFKFCANDTKIHLPWQFKKQMQENNLLAWVFQVQVLLTNIFTTKFKGRRISKLRSIITRQCDYSLSVRKLQSKSVTGAHLEKLVPENVFDMEL